MRQKKNKTIEGKPSGNNSSKLSELKSILFVFHPISMLLFSCVQLGGSNTNLSSLERFSWMNNFL
jgi:hypothetical protein